MQKKKNPFICLLLRVFILFLCTSSLLFLSGLKAKAQERQRGLYRFLQNEMGFSDEEVEEVRKGSVVTKLLETNVKHEVAIFTISRINVPKEFYLKHFEEDGMSLETAKAYKMGKFSNPPKLDDVRDFTLPREDIEELTKCEIGNCKVKMGARGIKAFHKLDKTAPDFLEKANRLAQGAVVRYVQRYLKRGNKALAEYQDKGNPTRIADEFHELLSESPYVFSYVPELHNYLENFPKSQLKDARSVIYWMKEDLEGADYPILSINHMVFYQRGANRATIIASKQLYATHYFEAAFRLTGVVNDRERERSGFYLIHIERSRIDFLRSIPGFFKGRFLDEAYKLIHKKMISVKKNIEGLYEKR